jgi:formylglycine-generating enzyme required for sulfatase activity
MKRILLLLSFSLSLLTLAQTPKTISYQGVARNATGQPIPNQSIKIKLSLLQTASSSASLYTETHTLTTTGQGLFALQIGSGTVLNGTYTNLNWSNGPAYVKTEIDPNGGDNYTLTSTNPLNAVPFALFAASGTPGPRGLKGDTGATGPQGPAGVGLTEGTTVGQMLFWNGSSWITLNPGTSGQALTMCNGLPTWTTNGVCPANNLATLTTTTISSITSTTAISGGNISNDGGGSITARGVVWSTSQNPTVALTSKTLDGGGTGSFTSNLTGLSPNTVYYLRAYATNSAGTAYGNEVIFTSAAVILASITSSTVSSITSTAAMSGGNIINNGGGIITARGVIWSISQNPTIALSTKTVDGSGAGIFTSSITGLSASTIYYVRAYATNSAGTAYGNQQSFTTLPEVPLIIETSLIPAGTFTMGSPGNEPERRSDEVQHQVTLSSFRMSKYEITNVQYAEFLNAKGIGSDGLYPLGTYPTQTLIYENTSWGLIWTGTQWQPAAGKEIFPVVFVTWWGAVEFANYAGGRLPTEAEWEYACRSGASSAFSTGNCLNDIQANYQWSTPLTGCNNTITIYPGQTQAVNNFSPNSFGLYNMHGNVWEWCADWYGAYPSTTQTNPTGPASGSFHVLRGGGFNYFAADCRSAARYGIPGDGNINDNYGFRVAFAP